MSRQRLLEAVAARGPRIGEAALADMYRNPFWEERFGERGRRFAREDGGHHLSYLVQALAAEDPAVLVRYAQWLRTVVTSRGMCTRHLAENFRRLRHGFAAEQGEEPLLAEAVRYLEAAEAALAHSHPQARELQRATPALAQAVVDELCSRHPEWAASRARCLDDLHYHLDYLADALALGRPELFGGYVAFMCGFLQRRGVPPAHLLETLEVLAHRLAGQPGFSEGLRTLGDEALRLARDAVAGNDR